MSLPAQLLPLLGLDVPNAPRLVQIMGAGGKTTLMYALAHGLQAQGQRVLSATTTRIMAPTVEQSPAIVLARDHDDLPLGVSRALERRGHATLAQDRAPGGKLVGVAPEVLDALLARDPGLFIVAECDGAAGRSLKAHRPHEPVLSDGVSLVIMVVGLDVIGAPLDDALVHGPALLAQRTGLAVGTTLTPGDVARAIAGEDGYLDQVPAAARCALWTSKLTPERVPMARALTAALARLPASVRLERVVAASLTEARRIDV